MTCSNCGAAVSGDSAVCQSCSAPVQQAGQPAQSGHKARQASGGWSRRKLLKYGGSSALGLGVLAWFFTGDGPAAVVKQFFRALNQGNAEKVERMTHDVESATLGYLARGAKEETTLSVDETTVTENTGQEAVVKTAVTTASTTSAESTTSVLDISLERESGEWKISDITKK